MHSLTSSVSYELEVELWDQEGKYASAHYDSFRIEAAGDADYYLRVSGFRAVPGERTAGDSLSWFNGVKFGAADRPAATNSCYTGFANAGGW